MAQAAAWQSHNGLFAVLTIDGRRFFLAQVELHTVESVLNVDSADPLPGAVGWFCRDGEKWPV